MQVNDVAARAAFATLNNLGYTYNAGAVLWKPPIGPAPGFDNVAEAERQAEKTARHGAAFGFGPQGFDVYRREYRDRDRAGEAEPLQVWEEFDPAGFGRVYYATYTRGARWSAAEAVHKSSQYRAVELRTNRGGQLTVNRGATRAAIHRWFEEQAASASGTVVSIGQRAGAPMPDAIRCVHERIDELTERAGKQDSRMARLERAGAVVELKKEIWAVQHEAHVAFDELRCAIAPRDEELPTTPLTHTVSATAKTVLEAEKRHDQLAVTTKNALDELHEIVRSHCDRLEALENKIERVAAATVGPNFAPESFTPDNGGNLAQQIEAVRAAYKMRLNRLEIQVSTLSAKHR